MQEDTKIVLPHGGFRNLIVYKKSDVVYEGTVVFCRRFLPAKGDRTVDQMIQAARSCKQNIAEGSAASGISKETELKLTNVARATLDELIEDYRDYLKSHDFPEWTMEDEKRMFVRNHAKTHNEWMDWKEIFETRPADVLANVMITLCNQTSFLLGKMIARQESDFRKLGGVRERMHAARTAVRGEDFDRVLYSRLAAAESPEALEAGCSALLRQIDSVIRSIKRKKGW